MLTLSDTDDEQFDEGEDEVEEEKLYAAEAVAKGCCFPPAPFGVSFATADFEVKSIQLRLNRLEPLSADVILPF